MMTAGYWVALVCVSPLFIYVVARLIFAAWFFTKREFERRKHYE